MNIHRAPLVLLVASLFLAATAVAQPPPSTADRATARALAEEGIAALGKNDFATAADRLARADALVHAPTFLVALAEAQLGLGQLLNAAETYNRILREDLAPGAPTPFVEARAEATRELAKLLPRMPSLTIQVTGPCATAAAVTIDGIAVPPAALGVRRPVDLGSHVIRAARSGCEPLEVQVTVVERQNVPVALEPRPAKAAPPEAHATPPLPPVAASDSRGTRRVLGVVGLAAGGAGLALGAVTGALAVGKHSSLVAACGSKPCGGHDGEIDAYHTLGTLSTVGVIAGGALAATGAVLFFTAGGAQPATAARLVPIVGPGFLGVKGRF